MHFMKTILFWASLVLSLHFNKMPRWRELRNKWQKKHRKLRFMSIWKLCQQDKRLVIKLKSRDGRMFWLICFFVLWLEMSLPGIYVRKCVCVCISGKMNIRIILLSISIIRKFIRLWANEVPSSAFTRIHSTHSHTRTHAFMIKNN